jgi:hypothetical protein
MMPSGHIAVAAVATAVLINRQSSKSTWITAALACHVIPDALPHAEPSLLAKGSFLDPSSFAFWWTVADHLLAVMIAGIAVERFPILCDWRFFLLAFVAWVPDVFEALAQMYPAGLTLYHAIHSATHIPWKTWLDVHPNIPNGYLVWTLGWLSQLAACVSPLFIPHLLRKRRGAYKSALEPA